MSAEFITALRLELGEDLIRNDAESLNEYGRDWTRLHTPKPIALALPRSAEQVQSIVSVCNRFQHPIVPSGGRTGLAGGAVAAAGELVVSMEKMRRIDPVDTTAHTVRVEAGVVTDALQEHCKPSGLMWPVDFASSGSSQIGGNIATNAGGIRVIRYGLTRNWVLGLEVCTATGQMLQLNGALEKNNTGLDLRQLFIGTEGTLGIVTAATLKLAPIPQNTVVAVFGVTSLKHAVDVLGEARRAGDVTLLAFEYFDRGSLQSVMDGHALGDPFANPHDGYVLLEIEPSAPNIDTDVWFAELFERTDAVDAVVAQSPREQREMWQYRELISESLAKRGLLHKNDVAVGVSDLDAFTARLHGGLQAIEHPHPVFVFGHVGDGNLHINTLNQDGVPKDRFMDQCKRADRVLFDVLREFRGSVSAEHGIGLLKRSALPVSRSADERALMGSIKAAMDPNNILNPGKILSGGET